MNLDQVRLNFSPGGLPVLNVILALILFGVALDLRPADLRSVARAPRGPLVALAAQILVVPAITYLLTRVLDPLPSIAMGMILVAACPSGNISNFLTHLAGGNTALSIGATALSTALAVIVTPFNVALWGSLNPKTAGLLRAVHVEPFEVLGTIALVLGLPLIAGMCTAAYRPSWAARLRRPIRALSLLFFAAFVAVALAANLHNFVAYVRLAFVAVFLENTAAFAVGFAAARLARMSDYDARAMAIEVGIHNSGLGLVLVFNFFGGSGGMALIAAWWGIWHIIAGLALALYWSRRPIEAADQASPEVQATRISRGPR